MKQSSQSQRTRYERKGFKYGQQTIPRFLAKTYQILQKQQHDNIISWNSEGNGFIVKNITEFTEKILPRYFKHNNYASFVRQLNMYGFHKVKSTSTDAQIFTHEKFLRDNRDALKEIKRKVRNEGHGDKNEEQHYQVVSHSYNEPSLIDEIILLKKKQDQLERVVDVLAEQNKQILQDNKRLWKRMKKTMERQDKKFQKILFLFLLNGGHNPEELRVDKQQLEGSNPELMKQALLPISESQRQNIMDALLSRFNSQHKPNYKDQLYLHNNGEHMKLLNSVVNNLNQNKEDNKYMLELQNQPSSGLSPISFPQQDKLLSPIPHGIIEQQEEDLNNLNNLSLQKGISSQFPPFADTLGDMQSDFMDDK